MCLWVCVRKEKKKIRRSLAREAHSPEGVPRHRRSPAVVVQEKYSRAVRRKQALCPLQNYCWERLQSGAL